MTDCSGPAGFVLIIYFTVNTIFVGQSLGLSWIMVEGLHPEFRDPVRDPYMVIAEKAAGPRVRQIVSVCVTVTLLGAACVILVLLGSFLHDIGRTLLVSLSSCVWQVLLAVLITPVCWLGTPKDFW